MHFNDLVKCNKSDELKIYSSHNIQKFSRYGRLLWLGVISSIINMSSWFDFNILKIIWLFFLMRGRTCHVFTDISKANNIFKYSGIRISYVSWHHLCLHTLLYYVPPLKEGRLDFMSEFLTLKYWCLYIKFFRKKYKLSTLILDKINSFILEIIWH